MKQKYEYRTLNLYTECHPDGKSWWKSQETVLNELGQEGWELVSVATNSEAMIAYLKRSISTTL